MTMTIHLTINNNDRLNDEELKQLPALILPYEKLYKAVTQSPFNRVNSAVRRFIDALCRHQQIRKKNFELQLRDLGYLQLFFGDDIHYMKQFCRPPLTHKKQNNFAGIVKHIFEMINYALRK